MDGAAPIWPARRLLQLLTPGTQTIHRKTPTVSELIRLEAVVAGVRYR